MQNALLDKCFCSNNLCCSVEGCCTCTVKCLRVYVKHILLSAFMQPWAISSWGRTFPFLHTLPPKQPLLPRLSLSVCHQCNKRQGKWILDPEAIPVEWIASCPCVYICFFSATVSQVIRRKTKQFYLFPGDMFHFPLSRQNASFFLKPWSIADFNLQKLVS